MLAPQCINEHCIVFLTKEHMTFQFQLISLIILSSWIIFLSTRVMLTSPNVAFPWAWCHGFSSEQFSANTSSFFSSRTTSRALQALYICITVFFPPLDLFLNYVNWFLNYFSSQPCFVSVSFQAYITFQDIQSTAIPQTELNLVFFFIYIFFFIKHCILYTGSKFVFQWNLLPTCRNSDQYLSLSYLQY